MSKATAAKSYSTLSISTLDLALVADAEKRVVPRRGSPFKDKPTGTRIHGPAAGKCPKVRHVRARPQARIVQRLRSSSLASRIGVLVQVEALGGRVGRAVKKAQAPGGRVQALLYRQTAQELDVARLDDVAGPFQGRVAYAGAGHFGAREVVSDAFVRRAQGTEHARAADKVDGFVGRRAVADQVAQANHRVRLLLFEFGQNRLERDDVGVNVADDS